ncbi:MAG: HEAT repeat domain-containing protein [Planctomycetota bacterium]
MTRNTIALLVILLIAGYNGSVISENGKTSNPPTAPISPTPPAPTITPPTPITPSSTTITPTTPAPISPTPPVPVITQTAPITPSSITITPTTPTKIEKPLPKDGITEKEINDLITKLSQDDLLVMNEARDELIEIGKPAIPLLHKTLENAKSDVRYLICEILGEIRDERSIEVLTKLLQDKEEYTASIASAAARGLKNFANTSVIPQLMQVITSTDIELRYESIKTLSTLRAYEALPLIRQMITDTAKTFLGYYVKAAAVQAIGKLKDTYSVKQLIPLLRNTDIEPATDEPFVKYVIKSLEQITDLQTGSFSKNDDKKKEQVIKKWEEWWEKSKNN